LQRKICLAKRAQLVAGHFHWTTYEAMVPRSDDVMIIFFRDPIERLRSFFRYVRSRGGQSSLSDFLSDGSVAQLDNAAVRLLGGVSSPVRLTEGQWDSLIDRAIHNLSRFNFVGLTEEVGNDLPMLFSLIGLPQPTVVPNVNVTPESARRSALADEDLDSPRVQSLLEERIRHDRVLYEHALRMRRTILQRQFGASA
jgi:hypothetical protein